MTETQKTILQALYQLFSSNPNEGSGDKEIAEALKIDVREVRYQLQELSSQNYISTLDASSSLDVGRIVVRELTPKGYMAVEGKL